MTCRTLFLSIVFIISSFQGSIAVVPDTFLPWEGGPAYYAKWSNGPSSSPDFFPIAVWAQNPPDSSLAQYITAGINVFVNIPPGPPAAADLAALSLTTMTTWCNQNAISLDPTMNRSVKGYHLASEPDNKTFVANPLFPTVKICTPIDTIVNRYKRIKAADPTRPVYLGFGQGAAEGSWYGRGPRTGHNEDYPLYAAGADILAFDIYPMNIIPASSDNATTKAYKLKCAQMPWRVADGVDSVMKYVDYKKPVICNIECTNYNSNAACLLTPEIVKAEVWMALVHGARGIEYFVHILTPFNARGLLADSAMTASVTANNALIKSLAPVLNTQSVGNGFTKTLSNTAVPVDAMLKRLDGYTYLFAVGMRSGATSATFTLRDFVGDRTVEVIGENRTIQSVDGVFTDDFVGYGVHLYKVSTLPTAIETVVEQNKKLKISKTAIAGEFAFESDENIEKLVVFSVSGKCIFSIDLNASKGTFQLRNTIDKLLLIKAILKNEIVLRKFIR